MTNRIEITPEMVKLAQQRTRVTGGDVRQEIARQVAQEAIYALDPELDFLVDEDAAFSRDDRLVTAFDVNDIVVNGLRFDVRLVGDDGRVSLPRYLSNSAYMTQGTLAVSFTNRTAAVVSFINKADWELQDKHLRTEDKPVLRADTREFNLDEILSRAVAPHSTGDTTAPTTNELTRFVGNRTEMPMEQQRKVVEAALNSPDCWAELLHVVSSWSKPVVRKTLTHAAVWNYKLEKMTETVQPKFPKLNRDDIKLIIARTGESVGGQAESPQFRKELLARLTKEELSRNLNGDQLRKASAIAEQVMAGRSVKEAVSEYVKNNYVVDLALTIKRQRQKVVSFLEATQEEFTMAMRQMAMQPVYATHSTATGVETLNEALKLLDACELAERARELEKELAV